MCLRLIGSFSHAYDIIYVHHLLQPNLACLTQEPIGVIVLEGCRPELGVFDASTSLYIFNIRFGGTNTREYELGSDTEGDMVCYIQFSKHHHKMT